MQTALVVYNFLCEMVTEMHYLSVSRLRPLYGHSFSPSQPDCVFTNVMWNECEIIE